MIMISPSRLAVLRGQYPIGCTVELIEMNDTQAPPPGTRGRVFCVDDIGTIHVAWETGSCLGVAYGEDHCSRVDA